MFVGGLLSPTDFDLKISIVFCNLKLWHAQVISWCFKLTLRRCNVTSWYCKVTLSRCTCLPAGRNEQKDAAEAGKTSITY